MEPVYVGMPVTARTFVVRKDQGGSWGEIRCGGPCKDDYADIIVYHQVPGQRYVKLQAAAMASFKAAERALGKKIFITGTGWRSCSEQTYLYSTDHSRYAPPATTGHCRGLCIDVDMNQTEEKLARIHRELAVREWYQARPDDEPWHFSMGLKV
jgi:hypothetical protein